MKRTVFLLFAMVALITLSCSTTPISEDIVTADLRGGNGNGKGKGKPSASLAIAAEVCPGMTAIDPNLTFRPWISYSVVSDPVPVYDFIERTFNWQPSYYAEHIGATSDPLLRYYVSVRWWSYDDTFTGIYITGLPCDYSNLTDGTRFNYEDIVYGFTIYASDDNILDDTDTLIEHGCITSTCNDWVRYAIDLPDGHYLIRWDPIVDISDEVNETYYHFNVPQY